MIPVLIVAIIAAAGLGAAATAATDSDPYLWLSNIHGAKALQWVKAQTAKSDALLKHDPGYRKDYGALLEILNAKDRIPEPHVDQRWVFNFWQDAEHVRGLWRRTTIADYDNLRPRWQILFDIDRYDRDTGKNWVWQGADCTPSFSRCLLALSPGGTDAHVIREFDPSTGKFLDDGFALSVAKSEARYIDENTILFATDFGPGSITPSSYPRIVKLWRRGEPLSAAKAIYQARPSDMAANVTVFRGPYGAAPLVTRRISFFAAEYFFVQPNGTTIKLPLPEGAEIKGVAQGQLIFTIRDDWRPAGGKPIGKGSLCAFPVLDFAAAGKLRPVTVLYTPGAHAMIDEGVSVGRDAAYAPIYVNVIGSIHEFRYAHGRWREAVLALPSGGSTAIPSTNDWGPEAYLTYQSFTTPPTLYRYDGASAPKAIKSEPVRFDASNLSVAQNWATSKDGTKIPYFIIRPKGANGPIPTILYGYGGFELSLTPWYWNDGHRPIYPGEPWFRYGGAIAVANIRGGGEFGPPWHQAALTYHRQRAYDDFEAVAEDIERRDISTPKQLGIVGASNGGLLVTAAMTERPDLFGAVVCQRPLIDMLRYTRFGAGASWVAEYGDPANAEMAAYIRTYSPYQNVNPYVQYPPVLFITETTDDRVTPVFARMMAAKMEDQGHNVLFNEATEGGHGPGSTHAEEAEYWALSYTFFRLKLGLQSGSSASTLDH